MTAAARTIGILGGTGAQGRGLARRLAVAGHEMIIGSRDAERAQATASELAAAGHLRGTDQLRGTDNATAAAEAELIIVAVPYDGHKELLTSLAPSLTGKIVIDCVNPLGFDANGPYALPVAEGSAAQQAAAVVPEAIVTAAFHHVSATHLDDADLAPLDEDVLVLGEDRAAVGVVIALAEQIPGVRALDAGRLRNAGQVEALTANLIAINRRYKTTAGLHLSLTPAHR